MKKTLLIISAFVLFLFLIPGRSAVGQTVVLTENFTGFSNSSHASPGSTDVSGTLDTKTTIAGWTGSKIYEAGGEIKLGTASIAGFIVTPSLDLSGNAGKYVLKFDLQKYGTDATQVQVYLDNVAVGSPITAPDTYQLSPLMRVYSLIQVQILQIVM
ncbi:MAG: hypothetical protein NT092_02890 [Bacteroidia bacterium]|nr:hypothetical protein [Bacteroidia bacterium]